MCKACSTNSATTSRQVLTEKYRVLHHEKVLRWSETKLGYYNRIELSVKIPGSSSAGPRATSLYGESDPSNPKVGFIAAFPLIYFCLNCLRRVPLVIHRPSNSGAKVVAAAKLTSAELKEVELAKLTYKAGDITNTLKIYI